MARRCACERPYRCYAMWLDSLLGRPMDDVRVMRGTGDDDPTCGLGNDGAGDHQPDAGHKPSCGWHAPVTGRIFILMGIITAEALYPAAFTTGANEISDLGGTRPPDSLIFQPSATIFDVRCRIGILVLAALVVRPLGFGRRSVDHSDGHALGSVHLGVGLFPGNTGTPHAIFAMVTFIAGGIAALAGSRVATGGFRVVSLMLGAVSLLTLALYLLLGDDDPMAELGIGGIERWIVIRRSCGSRRSAGTSPDGLTQSRCLTRTRSQNNGGLDVHVVRSWDDDR